MSPAERTVLAELSRLRPGTTLCAGELARRVFPGKERPLDSLRPVLLRMERSGSVRVMQRGQAADLETLRGPFRVATGGDQAR